MTRRRSLRRCGFGLVGVTIWSVAALGVASAADEEPPPEPNRGGPVLTIPIPTEDDLFAMMLGAAAALEPEVAPGETIAIDLRFAGTDIDPEVCLALSASGCIATLPVDDAGVVNAVVLIPPETVPGRYTATVESTALGIVELGEIVVQASPAPTTPSTSRAPATTQPPATTAAPATTSVEEPGAATAPVAVSLEPIEGPRLGLWFVLGVVAVLLLGWFGIRYLRRLQPAPAQQQERLSSLHLRTATQLPDRDAARRSAVAVRTRRLEPGEGFVVVALARDRDGAVADREIGRHETLDDAMDAARHEAAIRDTSVLWWEVRKHGSTLPVWIIEGDEAPVPSDGGAASSET